MSRAQAIDELHDAQLAAAAAAIGAAPRVIFHTFSNQGCAGLERCVDAAIAAHGAAAVAEKTAAFVFDSAADMHADAALLHQVITKSVAAELKALGMALDSVLDGAFARNAWTYCDSGADDALARDYGSIETLIAKIHATDAATLVLHSDHDRLIAPSKVDEFAEALAAPPARATAAARVTFRGPAHVRLFADDPARYEAELTALARRLQPPE